jgi:hypothetical protein
VHIERDCVRAALSHSECIRIACKRRCQSLVVYAERMQVTHHTIYPTRREAKAAILDYFELFNSRLRPHQTLDY